MLRRNGTVEIAARPQQHRLVKHQAFRAGARIGVGQPLLGVGNKRGQRLPTADHCPSRWYDPEEN